MNRELANRIITSLILFPILIYTLYYSGLHLILFLNLIYFLSFYEIIKNTKNILFIFFSNIVLIFALYSFFNLRGDTDYSLIIIYWILFTTFLSDIGGYIFGRIW